MMKPALFAVTIFLMPLAAFGQNPPSPAPHDSAIVFPVPDLRTQLDKLVADAKAKGSSGATIEDYGSYKIQLSVRSVSGGAEVHAHWDDVMMVEQGSATLITGGTVVDGKTGADGETHGSKIENGQSQKISPGDVLTVRAGTPHQLILEPGTVYGAVVVKVHEP
jgi:mannose-6-phosphate isomerase-like protein (cupin superfamily)